MDVYIALAHFQLPGRVGKQLDAEQVNRAAAVRVSHFFVYLHNVLMRGLGCESSCPDHPHLRALYIACMMDARLKPFILWIEG